MHQQEQHSMVANMRRNLNIAYWVMMVHQRAIIVPFRTGWGVKALGVPCFWAFGLMIAWAALSQDLFMWLWVGVWLIALVKRRQETNKLIAAGERIHSESDGWPEMFKKNDKHEKAAKLILEPFIVGFLGAFLAWVYAQYGMPWGGLPAFFLIGIVSLPFVEKIRQQIWENRVQEMLDSRTEQESLMNDVRNRMGDS